MSPADRSADTKSHRARQHRPPWMPLRPRWRGVILCEMVQRRQWILPLRSQRHATGSGVCSSRGIGRRKHPLHSTLTTIDRNLSHLFCSFTTPRTMWLCWIELTYRRLADIDAKSLLKRRHSRPYPTTVTWSLWVSAFSSSPLPSIALLHDLHKFKISIQLNDTRNGWHFCGKNQQRRYKTP